MSCLAWTLGTCVGTLLRARRQPGTRDIQRSVRHSTRPLRYTPRAVQQCTRHGVNAEWVEATILFPAEAGSLRGAPSAWFVREFGSRRIQVWATDIQGGQKACCHEHRSHCDQRVDLTDQAGVANTRPHLDPHRLPPPSLLGQSDVLSVASSQFPTGSTPDLTESHARNAVPAHQDPQGASCYELS